MSADQMVDWLAVQSALMLAGTSVDKKVVLMADSTAGLMAVWLVEQSVDLKVDLTVDM